MSRHGSFPSISQQILDFQDRTGDSQRAICRRAAEGGVRPALQQAYISRLVLRETTQWPGRDTIMGLAHAMATTPLSVVLGFAVEFGIPVDMPTFATRIPVGIDNVDERVTDPILTMLRTLATQAAED